MVLLQPTGFLLCPIATMESLLEEEQVEMPRFSGKGGHFVGTVVFGPSLEEWVLPAKLRLGGVEQNREREERHSRQR